MRFRRSVLPLVAFVVLPLTACNYGRKANVQGAYTKFNGSLEDERGRTIHVLENDTAIELGYFKEMLAAFNEQMEPYGIKAVDANMDQYTDLAMNGPYGYGPDVLYQANDVLMKYVKDRHILPIPTDKIEAEDQIPEAARKAYIQKVDGVAYTFGVPVNIQAPLMYYRRDTVPADSDKNGDGTPDMFETWNALYRYSADLHAADSERYGYMKSLNDQYFAIGYFLSYGGYIFGQDNTDARDIGFAAGQAELGAKVIKQLASVMNEECFDDSVTKNSYSKLAAGTYFATMTTPDVKKLFINQLSLAYQKDGVGPSEAQRKAEENLAVTGIPMLPANGDLKSDTDDFIPSKTLGGVNGYAISSYTKAPLASLAFVNFATSYEMIKKRAEMLEIAPARTDVATEIGGVALDLYRRMADEEIVIMPSISAVAQMWDPVGTLLADLAQDAFRSKEKYVTNSDYKEALAKVSQQIYDAVFTLK